jgi:hypothetical protein
MSSSVSWPPDLPVETSSPSRIDSRIGSRIKDDPLEILKGDWKDEGRRCLSVDEHWIAECGKFYDYLCVDISPANFFVLNCPPNLIVQFASQQLFVRRSQATPPTFFLRSTLPPYKPLYCPLNFSIVLDLLLSMSNKGYRSCSLAIISTRECKARANRNFLLVKNGAPLLA